ARGGGARGGIWGGWDERECPNASLVDRSPTRQCALVDPPSAVVRSRMRMSPRNSRYRRCRSAWASSFEKPTNPSHDIGVQRATGRSRLTHHRDDVHALNADSEEGSVGKRAVPVVSCVVVISYPRITDH